LKLGSTTPLRGHKTLFPRVSNKPSAQYLQAGLILFPNNLSVAMGCLLGEKLFLLL